MLEFGRFDCIYVLQIVVQLILTTGNVHLIETNFVTGVGATQTVTAEPTYLDVEDDANAAPLTVVTTTESTGINYPTPFTPNDTYGN